ncbi:ATP-dependent RNA helicase DDX19A-like isoform X2 [Scyliorhinus torazame]|uniref:ATP-dependent RNA helicase DDX19A-like isoform X2 n=1 Tax=Scyliorhinus torazame TaxID=75743 RepID=UPI003B5B1CC7
MNGFEKSHGNWVLGSERGSTGELHNKCRKILGSLKIQDKLHKLSTSRQAGASEQDNQDGDREADEDGGTDLATQSLLNKLIRKTLFEPSHSVEVLQKDPSSPLYSVKSFEELRLKGPLLQGVYSMGFNRPSKIQEAALPMMLADPRGSQVEEQIVIGTPGTVLDWCFKLGQVDVKKIRVFVLDEADVMIATQGYLDQSYRIHRMLPKDCQMLLFSATFEDPVLRFAKKIVPEPNVIKLRREQLTLDNIKQYFVMCNQKEDKYQALTNIYTAITIAQAIIFCQTRRTAQWLSIKLTHDGHRVALLTGDLMVEQRASIIQRFRDGKEKVLVTTNVCARGIDVEQVSIVVNFDLPLTHDKEPDCETYLHRIGRTGRFGKQGLAVNMVDGCKSLDILHRIQDHFNRKIQQLDSKDLEQIERIAY